MHRFVSLYASFEKGQIQQKLISNMDPLHRPLHLFADSNQRCPPAEFQRCKALLEHALQEVDGLKQRWYNNEIDKKTLRKQCGTISEVLVEDICLILDQIVFLEEGQCLLCNKNCPFTPRAAGTVPHDAFWIEVAGNTCKPWSPLNGKSRQVGSLIDAATLEMLIWPYAVRFSEPDLVIQENVKQLDHTIFKGILTDKDAGPKSAHARASAGKEVMYQVQVQNLRLDKLGFPSKGERKYMTALLNKTCSWMQGVPSFMQVFAHMTLDVDASVYMVASPDMIKAHFDEVAESQHLFSLQSCNSSWHDLLAPGERARLLQKKEFAITNGMCEVDDDGNEHWTVLVALTFVESNIRFSGVSCCCIERLKTNAKVYDMVSKRTLCPAELWLAQGWPANGVVSSSLSCRTPHDLTLYESHISRP